MFPRTAEPSSLFPVLIQILFAKMGKITKPPCKQWLSEIFLMLMISVNLFTYLETCTICPERPLWLAGWRPIWCPSFLVFRSVNSIHYSLSTVQSIYSIHYTLSSHYIQYTLYTVQSIYSIHYTLSSHYKQYTLYTVQSLYSIHYTLSSHYTVYIIHCPVNIQYTLYTVQSL